MCRIDAQHQCFRTGHLQVSACKDQLAGEFVVVLFVEGRHNICEVERVEDDFGGVAVAQCRLDVGIYLGIVKRGGMICHASEEAESLHRSMRLVNGSEKIVGLRERGIGGRGAKYVVEGSS